MMTVPSGHFEYKRWWVPLVISFIIAYDYDAYDYDDYDYDAYDYDYNDDDYDYD